MKVLVLSGCAHRAYIEYLKAAHPRWDVRAVVPHTAEQWVNAKEEKFLTFLADLDVFIGLTNNNNIDQYIPAKTQRISVPTFTFFGYHPDAIFLGGIPSVLERGLCHSRLTVSSYLDGLDRAQTEARFNAETYAKLGYFDERDISVKNTLKYFQQHKSDITPVLEFWLKQQEFLYYPSHPKIELFFDLMDYRMRENDLPPEVSPEVMQKARAEMDDYLEEGVHWPVYKEIAEHHGIKAFPAQWRASTARGTGEQFDLAVMIDRSMTIYDACGREKLEAAYSTAEKLRAR